jgi:hypothetical protein
VVPRTVSPEVLEQARAAREARQSAFAREGSIQQITGARAARAPIQDEEPEVVPLLVMTFPP